MNIENTKLLKEALIQYSPRGLRSGNAMEEGHTLLDLANATRRKPLELSLLVMDRLELKMIKPRKIGIFVARKLVV